MLDVTRAYERALMPVCMCVCLNDVLLISATMFGLNQCHLAVADFLSWCCTRKTNTSFKKKTTFATDTIAANLLKWKVQINCLHSNSLDNRVSIRSWSHFFSTSNVELVLSWRLSFFFCFLKNKNCFEFFVWKRRKFSIFMWFPILKQHFFIIFYTSANFFFSAHLGSNSKKFALDPPNFASLHTKEKISTKTEFFSIFFILSHFFSCSFYYWCTFEIVLLSNEWMYNVLYIWCV